MFKLQLLLAEKDGYVIVSAELAEDVHSSGVVGAVLGVDGEARVVAEKDVGYLCGVAAGFS